MDTTARSPRYVTSKRTIIYRKSEWDVHEFEVWSGERLCRIAALRMPGSLLVWLGGGGGGAALGAAALGLPAARGAPGAACTVLRGSEDAAAEAVARRLAAALACPVHVLCGASFDHFTLPLVERALLTHLKSLPAHE